MLVRGGPAARAGPLGRLDTSSMHSHMPMTDMQGSVFPGMPMGRCYMQHDSPSSPHLFCTRAQVAKGNHIEGREKALAASVG